MEDYKTANDNPYTVRCDANHVNSVQNMQGTTTMPEGIMDTVIH